MAQKLILPINKCRVTAGYKNANYKRDFGYNHYGADLTDRAKSDRTIWASGVGEVTHAGWSNSGGNVVIVVYRNCELADGRIKDIAVRYYHLDKIYAKVGQKTTKDTKLGLYGNTGSSSGAHLHIECDTDIKYPNYTPQIAKNSGILKAGTDSTLNPAIVFFAKASSPDWQEVFDSGYDTVASSDLAYKVIK